MDEITRLLQQSNKRSKYSQEEFEDALEKWVTQEENIEELVTSIMKRNEKSNNATSSRSS